MSLMSPIIMNKIIDFDNSFEFAFLEDSDIKIQHPVSDYFTKLDDLSINLLISLKWIKWGYKFLTLISENLDTISNEYPMEDLISNSLQDLKQLNIKEKKKIIIIDDELINDNFEEIVVNFYSKDFFDENTKVHLKLKLNFREYLIITNYLYPTFIKFN